VYVLRYTWQDQDRRRTAGPGLRSLKRINAMKPITAIFAVLFLMPVGSRAAEELTVLKPAADGVAPGKQLELWLKQEFYRQVERRSEAFETLPDDRPGRIGHQMDR
jgi:hypothetical protein